MHPLFFKILRIELENSNFQTSVAAVFETNATLKESSSKHETSLKSCEPKPRICIKLKVTMNNPLGICLLLQMSSSIPQFIWERIVTPLTFFVAIAELWWLSLLTCVLVKNFFVIIYIYFSSSFPLWHPLDSIIAGEQFVTLWELSLYPFSRTKQTCVLT